MFSFGLEKNGPKQWAIFEEKKTGVNSQKRLTCPISHEFTEC